MPTAAASPGRFRRARHRDGLFRSITANTALWPDATAFHPVPAETLPATVPAPDNAPTKALVNDAPTKALLVNAHPDDESESAAFVYRLTHELGGIVDHVVVTNGEGGHHYAALAESYYRLPLTAEADRRGLLARIRREEVMRSSRILGIRHTYFLGQKDTGVTLNAQDAFEAWDIARIKHELRNLLQFEKYDLVVLLLPAADTHGHHQTVAALTLEAVAEMEMEDRPAALGVRTAAVEAADSCAFRELNRYPLTRTTCPEPVWRFNRHTPLACHHSLDYSIVVNWVIAEHKSQGFFQLEGGRRTQEQYWLFEASGHAGAARWRDFLQTMDQ